MSSFLLQSTATSIVVFLQDQFLGTGVTDLVSTDVTVSLKKSTDALFNAKILTPATNATANIGSGANGTVSVAIPGTAGNSFTVSVVVPVGTSPLSATVVGNIITVNLSVTGGIPNAAQNTATLVATALENANDLIIATASGTGADPLTIAEGPTTLTGGTNGDFVHIGSGYYRVALSAVDTNTLGSFYVRVIGPDISDAVESATIAAVTPVVPPTLPVIPTTTITGTIFEADGTPAVNICVQARVLTIPTIEGGVGITTETLVVRTDSNGYFTMDLITGSQVDIIIASVGYRRTIIVPVASSNLFDIP